MTKYLNPSGSTALPRPARLPILIPVVIFASTLSLIAWSAWPVLRPNRTLEVTQAVFVQNAVPATNPSTGNINTDSPRTTRTVQAAGWLEAEPFYFASTALTDGIIKDMLVLEGDLVQSGQVLARMVDDEAKLRLIVAETEVARARASLEESRSNLRAAESNWNEPFELERAVTSSHSLLQERSAELAQLPALIRVEQSLLIQAQEEFKSVEQTYSADAASELELITARELANAQDSRVEALRAREQILRSAIDRHESDHYAAQRALDLRIDDRARLDSAHAKLQHAQAELAQKQANRDEALLELERMTIVSPITGYVQRRLKAPGDKVVRMMDDPYSAHIAHIYDPSQLQVRVDVPLADASQVFVGQRCEVVVEVLPERVFEGVVLRVTHEADLQKNTLQVKVKVHEPNPVLRPEMLTRVKFISEGDVQSRSRMTIESSDTTVRVPSVSIESDGHSSHVWLVTERANGRGVLQPVSVTLIEIHDGWVTVSGQIQPGSLIAADPRGCTQGERVQLRSTNGGES